MVIVSTALCSEKIASLENASKSFSSGGCLKINPVAFPPGLGYMKKESRFCFLGNGAYNLHIALSLIRTGQEAVCAEI